MNWYDSKIHERAPKGGEIDPLNGKFYRGGEREAFYVPRPVMPQVDEKFYPELFKFASERGICIRSATIDPAEKLRPHQHIDKLKAKHMGDVEPAVLAKPILTSRDDFILDGNHRWLAHVMNKLPVPVYELALEFEEAIRFLFEFPHTYSYGDGELHPVSA